MAKKIDSKSKRNRLAKRNEPYWDKVVWGGYVGYRVGEKEGVWKARYRIESGEQRYKTLVLPPHLPVNEYDAAVSEAKKWFDSIQAGNQARPGQEV